MILIDSDDASPTLLNLLQSLLRYRRPTHPFNAEPFHRLLGKLGHPERSLPPTIHITGTNGKGSTTAFIHHALKASGYRFHVFTSPHLERLTQRFILNNQEVEEDLLIQAMRAIVPHVDETCPITLFEIFTATAFLLFSAYPADGVIMEVGIGGHKDPTNIINSTVLSVITSIDYDHEDLIGPTLGDIARSKAKIMRENAPVVIAPQQHAVVQEVLTTAGFMIDAPLWRHGHEWDYTLHEEGFSWSSPLLSPNTLDYPAPSLRGAHQIANAATAITALKVQQQWALQPMAEGAMLAGTQWPGRLESLEAHFLDLPDTWEVLIDGAHNPAGARALVQFIQDQWMPCSAPLFIVIGMQSHRPIKSFVEAFLEIPAHYYIVKLNEDSMGSQERFLANNEALATIQESFPHPFTLSSSFVRALGLLQQQNLPQAKLLICGSFYLLRQVLRLKNQHKPYLLLANS